MTSSGRHSFEYIDDGGGKRQGWVCLGGDLETVVEECLLATESLEQGRSRSDWVSGMGEYEFPSSSDDSSSSEE